MKPKENKPAIFIIFFLVLLFAGLDILLGKMMIPEDFSYFRVQNSYYHHGLKKNVSATTVWGPLFYNFHTNSLSFRDQDIKEIPLQSANKRIMIMGDSHAEGVGVDFIYTYAGRLQEIAKPMGIEILNASAVSYSPKIHFLKCDYLLNNKGLQVDEIWVAIDISDLQNEIAYQQFQPVKNLNSDGEKGKMKRLLRRKSFTAYTLSELKRQKENRKLNETLMGMNSNKGSLPDLNSIDLYKEFFRSFSDEELLRNPDFHGVSEWIYNDRLRELADQGLELGFENISKLKKLCNEKNITLRLSVHPWQTQVLKKDTSDYYVESWRRFCHTEEIDFINLYPVFINRENPVMIARSCYIEGDNHWNELGHKRVAAYLREYLN